MSNTQACNRLLAALAPEDREVFEPCLEAVELSAGDVLAAPDVPAPYAYFLDSGVAATVLSDRNRSSVEVGLTGNEGLIGLAIVLGAAQCPRQSTMLIRGRAQRIASKSLTSIVGSLPGVQAVMMKYVHTFILQTSTTAFAHCALKTEEKLARWLLMVQDRLGSDAMNLSHDFYATVLGLRRPGVTTAIHVLEGDHCIKAARSRITVLDRPKLQALAGRSYGVAEAEYLRLFGKRDAADRDNLTASGSDKANSRLGQASP